MVVTVSVKSSRVYFNDHVQSDRLHIKRHAVVREFAQETVGMKSLAKTLSQRVRTNLRVNWTLGSLIMSLDGDPFTKPQRFLVMVSSALVNFAVSLQFFTPEMGGRQVCEGTAQENGYPTQCIEGWLESGRACTCKVFDCDSCDCDRCDSIGDCDRLGCAEIMPNGMRAVLLATAVTIPSSFLLNRVFHWLHEPYM